MGTNYVELGKTTPLLDQLIQEEIEARGNNVDAVKSAVLCRLLYDMSLIDLRKTIASNALELIRQYDDKSYVNRSF